jgi:hypothetical protein
MRPLTNLTLAALALASTACASARTKAPMPADPPGDGPDSLLLLLASDEGQPADPAKASPGRTTRTRTEDPKKPGFVRKGPGARLLAPAPLPPAPPEGTPPEPLGNWEKEMFPGDGWLYDPYLAAQRQCRTAVKVIFPTGGDDNRKKIENTIGFDVPVIRWTDRTDSSVATELQFEAAVFARFDRHERWDMDASDWKFGVPLAHRDGDLAWKIELYHLTSHLGDEFMERTGALPLDYHLEEAAFGLSWDASAGQRLYGEAGVAVYTSGPTDNGRIQAGWEWVGNKATTGLSPFMAIDLESRHDTNWIPGKTAVVGVAFGRHVRMGVEYYHGYDTQTQFQKLQVQYVSLGLAMDF